MIRVLERSYFGFLQVIDDGLGNHLFAVLNESRILGRIHAQYAHHYGPGRKLKDRQADHVDQEVVYFDGPDMAFFVFFFELSCNDLLIEMFFHPNVSDQGFGCSL